MISKKRGSLMPRLHLPYDEYINNRVFNVTSESLQHIAWKKDVSRDITE